MSINTENIRGFTLGFAGTIDWRQHTFIPSFGGNVSIGFAIAVDAVRLVVNQIIRFVSNIVRSIEMQPRTQS